jgi:hypothetical protein
MNSREKGRMLELREAKVWRGAGYLVEDRHPAKFVGPGKTALCDFFNAYDLIAISRDRRVVVLVQVSTESQGSHDKPLGVGEIRYDFHPDRLLEQWPSLGINAPSEYSVHELYVYYRKLKGRGWVAERRWWF